jgi:hypothetical protein
MVLMGLRLQERNLLYVIQIEVFLSRIFGSWEEQDVGD